MADVQNIVEYFSNLLIVQYNQKPKAKALIELMVNELLASGILLDIRDGYDLDTAVGTQLDILGKYIGVDRLFQDNDLTDMFSLQTYTEADPTAAPRWGLVVYADYDTTLENGVLNYNSIVSKDFYLIDVDYRVLLKLKIIKNYSNGSHKEIDDALFSFFGTDVTAEQTDTMEMTYTVPFSSGAVINAAIIKSILPKPLGVRLVVTEV
ncbi:MAG: DUF2612 domain-containing protein [Alphaproteobacteria bacterium]|nr:DUF2612 domain-containing protein [Alphaproteobacteria bacterium]